MGLNEEYEKVQKLAARLVTRNYSSETGSVTGFLVGLKCVRPHNYANIHTFKNTFISSMSLLCRCKVNSVQTFLAHLGELITWDSSRRLSVRPHFQM